MGFMVPVAMAAVSSLASIGATVGAATAAGSTIGTALTVGSTILSAGSAIYGGVSNYQAGMYQAKIANMAAQRAEVDRTNSLIRGAAAETDIRMQGAKVLGAQKAGYASAGVDVGVGTPIELAAATQAEVDYDASVTHYNALSEAYGFSEEAWNQRANASMAKSGAKKALVSGVLQAGSSLMGGASSLGKQWSAMKSAGMGA